jgi:hypothetical protein
VLITSALFSFAAAATIILKPAGTPSVVHSLHSTAYNIG